LNEHVAIRAKCCTIPRFNASSGSWHNNVIEPAQSLGINIVLVNRENMLDRSGIRRRF
jgi:hypothetical protein